MDFDALVLRDGDRVTATGLLIRNDQGDWLQGPIPGFAHLEPRRHIPFITELDGPEAATLGTVLARVTRALREAADAEKVYVYVFGDHVPHLHFNLAPHRAGDGLRGSPGLLDPLSPHVDLAAHQAVATAVHGTLNASS